MDTRYLSPLARLHEAVMQGRYWVLRPTGGRWTLSILDTATGRESAPVYASDPVPDREPGDPPGPPVEVIGWAAGLVGVDDWSGLPDGGWIDACQHAAADVRWRPRDAVLALRVEDAHGTPVVVARERWSGGTLGTALVVYELAAFDGADHVLAWASARFGVDRDGWRQTGESEWEHD